MNKEIENDLKNILSTLNAKSDKELNSIVEETINSINESNLNKPERFNTFLNYKLERVMELVANSLHEPSICKNKNKPNFIYINYGFLEKHIQELCILKQGTSCCADKSRYILNMYFKYTLDGEIPEFNPNIEAYWIPNFGDNKLWMDYCDSLYELYYGRTNNYFKAYKELIESQSRKFKHILYTWYLELNDGDIIKVGNSWDDDSYCPLDKTSDNGDYYIINRRLINDKELDIYIPENEVEKFLRRNNYVKLPKSLIKKIYYETEEKMI